MGKALQVIGRWSRFSTAVVPVTLVVLFLSTLYDVPVPLVLAAAVLTGAWLFGVGVLTSVAVGAWVGLAGIAVVALALWWGSVVLTGGGAGLVAGAVGKLWLDRTERRRRERIDALPDWNRDELGPVADLLSADFVRTQNHRVLGSHRDAAVELLDAVCRPLPGATVLAQRPAVGVYGSRVAVVGEGELPPLPRGVTVRRFELDPIEVQLLTHELAVHLSAGAPADGDALSGRAAHLHHLTLQSLSG